MCLTLSFKFISLRLCTVNKFENWFLFVLWSVYIKCCAVYEIFVLLLFIIPLSVNRWSGYWIMCVRWCNYVIGVLTGIYLNFKGMVGTFLRNFKLQEELWTFEIRFWAIIEENLSICLLKLVIFNYFSTNLGVLIEFAPQKLIFR